MKLNFSSWNFPTQRDVSVLLVAHLHSKGCQLLRASCPLPQHFSPNTLLTTSEFWLNRCGALGMAVNSRKCQLSLIGSFCISTAYKSDQ